MNNCFQNNADTTVFVTLGATSLCIIMLLALMFNLMAIVTILRVPELRQTPHNLLVVNLAVADLGWTITSMPLSLFAVTLERCFLQNSILCPIMGVCSYFFRFANSLTVLAIAIDRVLIVTRVKLASDTNTRVRVMIVLSWVISIAAVAVVSIVTSMFPLDNDTPSGTTTWTTEVDTSSGVTNWTTDDDTSYVYFRLIRACDVEFNYIMVITFNVRMFGCVIPLLTVCYTIIGISMCSRGRKIIRCQREGQVSRALETTSPCILRRVTLGHVSKDREIEPPSSSVGCLDGTAVDCKDSAHGDWKGVADMSSRRPYLEKPENRRLNDLRRGSDQGSVLSDNRSASVKNDKRSDGDAETSLESGVEGTEGGKTGVTFNLTTTETLSASDANGDSKVAVVVDASLTPRKVRRSKFEKRHDVTQKRIVLMGGTIVLSNILCWLPYAVVRSLSVTGDAMAVPTWLGISTQWLTYCLVVIDPVVYAFMNRRVRQEIVPCRKNLVGVFR